jgi:hypothetical protein
LIIAALDLIEIFQGQLLYLMFADGVLSVVILCDILGVGKLWDDMDKIDK